jgi:hypothetical protein
MTLENVTGTLLSYRQFYPNTVQHVDQITNQRRINPELRYQRFYPADGNLYATKNNGCLFAITREPQNLFLQNVETACQQITNQGNYFPNSDEANNSFNHENTFVADLNRLRLIQHNSEYGHFVVYSKSIRGLSSLQRMIVQRIFGPDKDSFLKNIELFKEAKINPRIYLLMPDYVQNILKKYNHQFLCRPTWLDFLYFGSNFNAVNIGPSNFIDLRGEKIND